MRNRATFRHCCSHETDACRQCHGGAPRRLPNRPPGGGYSNDPYPPPNYPATPTRGPLPAPPGYPPPAILTGYPQPGYPPPAYPAPGYPYPPVPAADLPGIDLARLAGLVTPAAGPGRADAACVRQIPTPTGGYLVSFDQSLQIRRAYPVQAFVTVRPRRRAAARPRPWSLMNARGMAAEPAHRHRRNPLRRPDAGERLAVTAAR